MTALMTHGPTLMTLPAPIWNSSGERPSFLLESKTLPAHG
jgi:hypothetical protein